MTLKEQILEFVIQRERVRLPDVVEQFELARGELWFWSRNFENVVFWTGLSPDAIDTLWELLDEKRIFMHPSCLRAHLLGGLDMLLLPLAMSGRSYASPHWRPVVLCSDPL